MGVKDLWKILEPSRERVGTGELRDLTLAVDLSIWVCEAEGVAEMRGRVTKPYLRNLFFRVWNLLQLGVRLVFVVDGEAPELKLATMARRNQARLGFGRGRGKPGGATAKTGRSHFKRLLNECCEMLELMGVPFIQSVGEAEALCALLNQAGLVNGCITNDGDAFLYGATTIYRNFTIDKKMQENLIDKYTMPGIESALRLSRDKLLALGLLLGCDFVPKGVPGVGHTRALKLMQELPECDVLDRLCLWRSSRFVSASPLEEQIRERACRVLDFPSHKVIDEFTKVKDRIPKRLPQPNRPRMFSLQRLLKTKLEWEDEYAQEKVLLLTTIYDLRQISVNSSYAQSSKCLKPHSILKARVRQFIPVYEVRWQRLDNDEADNQYVTLEEQELFTRCFPELVHSFESNRNKPKAKKATKKGKSDENKENVEPGVITEESQSQEPSTEPSLSLQLASIAITESTQSHTASRSHTSNVRKQKQSKPTFDIERECVSKSQTSSSPLPSFLDDSVDDLLLSVRNAPSINKHSTFCKGSEKLPEYCVKTASRKECRSTFSNPNSESHDAATKTDSNIGNPKTLSSHNSNNTISVKRRAKYPKQPENVPNLRTRLLQSALQHVTGNMVNVQPIKSSVTKTRVTSSQPVSSASSYRSTNQINTSVCSEDELYEEEMLPLSQRILLRASQTSNIDKTREGKSTQHGIANDGKESKTCVDVDDALSSTLNELSLNELSINDDCDFGNMVPCAEDQKDSIAFENIAKTANESEESNRTTMRNDDDLPAATGYRDNGLNECDIDVSSDFENLSLISSSDSKREFENEANMSTVSSPETSRIDKVCNTETGANSRKMDTTTNNSNDIVTGGNKPDTSHSDYCQNDAEIKSVANNTEFERSKNSVETEKQTNISTHSLISERGNFSLGFTLGGTMLLDSTCNSNASIPVEIPNNGDSTLAIGYEKKNEAKDENDSFEVKIENKTNLFNGERDQDVVVISDEESIDEGRRSDDKASLAENCIDNLLAVHAVQCKEDMATSNIHSKAVDENVSVCQTSCSLENTCTSSQVKANNTGNYFRSTENANTLSLQAGDFLQSSVSKSKNETMLNDLTAVAQESCLQETVFPTETLTFQCPPSIITPNITLEKSAVSTNSVQKAFKQPGYSTLQCPSSIITPNATVNQLKPPLSLGAKEFSFADGYSPMITGNAIVVGKTHTQQPCSTPVTRNKLSLRNSRKLRINSQHGRDNSTSDVQKQGHKSNSRNVSRNVSRNNLGDDTEESTIWATTGSVKYSDSTEYSVLNRMSSHESMQHRENSFPDETATCKPSSTDSMALDSRNLLTSDSTEFSVLKNMSSLNLRDDKDDSYQRTDSRKRSILRSSSSIMGSSSSIMGSISSNISSVSSNSSSICSVRSVSNTRTSSAKHQMCPSYSTEFTLLRNSDSSRIDNSGSSQTSMSSENTTLVENNLSKNAFESNSRSKLQTSLTEDTDISCIADYSGTDVSMFTHARSLYVSQGEGHSMSLTDMFDHDPTETILLPDESQIEYDLGGVTINNMN